MYPDRLCTELGLRLFIGYIHGLGYNYSNVPLCLLYFQPFINHSRLSVNSALDIPAIKLFEQGSFLVSKYPLVHLQQPSQNFERTSSMLISLYKLRI